MLLSYLQTPYHTKIDQGYKALKQGNLQKAEREFLSVLEHEDDPHMTIIDSVDAHNGLGAVSLAHTDLFDAWRWYKEAEYLLDRLYEQHWPRHLEWSHPHDRHALATLAGLGHTSSARGDMKTAKKYYTRVLAYDAKDAQGIRNAMAVLAAGKHFHGDRHSKK